MVDTVTATAFSPPSFGPPISVGVAEPPNRPRAVAYVIDLSKSLFGDRKVLDVFKERLTLRFSNMEPDDAVYVGGQWHEDPGSAVAALKRFDVKVRDIDHDVLDAVDALSYTDRYYKRRLVMLTDQLLHRDTLAMRKALNMNMMRFMDIDFYVGGFGPQYTRTLADCKWNHRHFEEPSDVDVLLNEVYQ